MTTKRKLITAVASLGILVILAGVALGVALAALTGNVTSGFTINYTAYNVSAAISGNWGYDQDFMKAMTSNGKNEIVFTGSEKGSSAQKSFDPLGNIELSATNPSVTFKFRFMNFDEKALPISFTLDGDMENLDVNYTIKTYDGEDMTITPSASITDLPTTINEIYVPYSGYSSYDEYYQTLDYSEEDEEVLSLLKLFFTEGDEAVIAVLKEERNPQTQEDYEDIVEEYMILARFNVYRLFLETASDIQAIEYMDSIDLEALFPELIELSADSEAFFEDQYYYLKKEALMCIIGDCALKRRYDLAYNASLKYIDEGDPDSSSLANAVAIMFYNILDTLYTKGYDAAVAQMDELYERNYKYFNPEGNIWTEDEEYFRENYNSLKEMLLEMLDDDEYSTKEKRKEAFWSQLEDTLRFALVIMQTRSPISLAQDKLIDGIIEMFEMLPIFSPFPYTEITVTISLSDEADDAYLNSGNFNFVLG